MINLDIKDLETRVRSQSDKDRSGHLSSSQVRDFIEQSWKALYYLLVDEDENYYVDQLKIRIKSRISYFPANFYKIVAIDRFHGDFYTTLRKLNFVERQFHQTGHYRDYRSRGWDETLRYSYFDRKLIIHPSFDNDNDFIIYYAPNPPLISSGLAEITDGWEQWVVWDAAIKANIREESGINELKVLRDELWMQIKEWADARDQSSPDRIIDLNQHQNDRGYEEFVLSSGDGSQTFDDLLFPFNDERKKMPLTILRDYIAKANCYFKTYGKSLSDNVSYIGAEHVEDSSTWIIVKIQNRTIFYATRFNNSQYLDLESACAARESLTYTTSIEGQVVQEGDVRNVKLAWVAGEVNDLSLIPDLTFVSHDAPFGSFPFPPTEEPQARLIIGLSQIGLLDSLEIGGYNQAGGWTELGVAEGIRYYVSRNLLLTENYQNSSLKISARPGSVSP